MRTGVRWSEVIVTGKDGRWIGTGEMDATVDDRIRLALIQHVDRHGEGSSCDGGGWGDEAECSVRRSTCQR